MNMDEDELIIKMLVSPSNGCNVYVLISGDEAAVIDAANAYDDIRNILDEMGVGLKYLLVTHAHESHIQSVPMLKRNFGGTFCLHKLDLDLLKESDDNLEPDLAVKDNTTLKLKDIIIKVLHTPGHTMGSLCFYVKKASALFSGDTLLKGEFGRIWGPHSMGLMLRSLKRLNSVIPPKTTVYPGHGPLTSISDEAWLDGLDQLS